MHNPLLWIKKLFKAQACISINEEAILKAKSIRERIGGQNYHWQECNSIPTSVDKENHQLRRECYLTFTLVLVNSKKPVEKSQMRKSSRSPSGGLSKLNDSLLHLLEE